MNKANTCPQCGAAASGDESANLCPGCLLKSASNDSSASAAFEQTYVTPAAGKQGFVAPSAAELDALFPGLQIQELIGRGGMGAVYKARQPDLDRIVAVKILPREIQGDPAFGERFLREARTLAKLNHPNIVAVYDFGQVEDLFYFVMEFADGVTLRDTIAAGNVKQEEALRIVPALCDALQFAHEEGVVHRDIKPENILLDKRGRVKIADFGLAKMVKGDEADDNNLTGTHQVMGTVKYMAPEQMSTTKNVDHRADIYSLGVVFYELLTGELPMGWFAPPSKTLGVDVRIDEVVLRALEAEPSRRYQNASEVKSAVEAFSSASHVAPVAPGTPVASSTAEAATTGSAVRLHKLLDVTETRYRTLHHVTFIAANLLVLVAIVVALVSGRAFAAIPAGLLLAAIVTMIVSVQLKKQLVWEVTYKGHLIRFDNGGMLAEKLYLDDGLVQKGGFGTKMEIRTKIKAGEGLGDEIIVWFTAAFRYCRCRIDVEERVQVTPRKFGNANRT
ncbi:MAG: serine/threonine-protein kinase [Fuerstiella sp.]